MPLEISEKKIDEYLKYFRTRRKDIVEISNVKVYNIIRKLIKKLSVEDIMYVVGLSETSKRPWAPDNFNDQLQHVFNSLEFNKRDSAILREHLDKAEMERLKREEESRKFEEQANKEGRVLLPRLGIN